MSALPQALPLALSAAIYPPALLVLMLLMTGHEPRPLVLAYFAGAATLTLGAGLVALAVLDAANLTPRDSNTASGAADIVLGVLLLAVAAWAWRRSARGPRDAPAGQGRIAQWSQRATSSRRWALVLGLAMYLPSPLYLLAVKEIADGGGSSASKVAAVAICALGVLLFIEVPLVALYLRPAGVAAALERFNAWLGRNGWRLAAALALIAGVYAIVKGVAAL